MRSFVLSAAILALAPSAALALQPPHDGSQATGCDDCHRMHNALGNSLTTFEQNANLCESCHSSISDPDGKHFGFPWTGGDQAVPGSSGRSHRWDADVTARGARVPTSAMSTRLDQGKITCSTCHNSHNNGGEDPAEPFKGGRQHVGGPNGGTVTVGEARIPDAGGGTGRMSVATVGASALPVGYRIRISAIEATGVRFKISHDRGKTWLAWGGAAWALDDAAGSGVGRLAGASGAETVPLDDAAVGIAFADAAAAYAVGAAWDFWISYPMLRVANDDDAMCYDCHANRVHTSTQVQGDDPALPPNGLTTYSHPVNAGLTPGRHHTTPLDVDGSSGAGDGNGSNDLVLVGGAVRCTTCHSVHNADSNSITADR